MSQSLENVKLMTIGDGAVGKTLDKFPDEYVPTVFDNYNCTMVYDNRITDTAGQDDYEQMRPLAYPEVRKFDDKVPVVLCGTKIDLLDDKEYIKKMEESGTKCVTVEEVENLAQKIGAYTYVLCSGKTQKGMTEVFTKCAEAGLLYQEIITEDEIKGGKKNDKAKDKNKKPDTASGGCCLIS